MRGTAALLSALSVLLGTPATAQIMVGLASAPDPGLADELPQGQDDSVDLQTSEEVARSRGEEPSQTLRTGKGPYLLSSTGWTVLPYLAAGAAAGYFLTPRLGLEAAYEYGEMSFYSLHTYAQVATVRARYFWGNTFYTNLGLARRKLGASFTPQGAGGSASAERSELALETSAGNLWQWNWVSFGIDWAGALWPLAKLADRDDFAGRTLSSETEREKQDLYDRLAGGPTYMVAKLWLGVAF